ncbi:MAG TPA: hypothetical protein VKY85_25545 [Candidatus Angelobacter sp.]|nr:hypothetical protein [Candidatus Angelobacter sp.]
MLAIFVQRGRSTACAVIPNTVQFALAKHRLQEKLIGKPPKNSTTGQRNAHRPDEFEQANQDQGQGDGSAEDKSSGVEQDNTGQDYQACDLESTDVLS